MRARRGALSRWLVDHLPVPMTIAATGAVRVSTVAHSSVDNGPAMVLSAPVAIGVLALVLVATSLADWRDLAPVYRPVSVALGLAAVVAVPWHQKRVVRPRGCGHGLRRQVPGQGGRGGSGAILWSGATGSRRCRRVGRVR